MLAAWFRLKYPHVAIGALASSAPVLYFDDIVPSNSYYATVTKDFQVKINSLYHTKLCTINSCQEAGLQFSDIYSLISFRKRIMVQIPPSLLVTIELSLKRKKEKKNYIVLWILQEASLSCYNTIKSSWSEIDRVAAKPNGLSELSKKFNTCM